MLKVAVPNKGALAASASEMLREAGYRQRRDERDLVVADPANGVEFFYLRPRDIAVYVGGGTLDIGLTGRDLVMDSRAAVQEREHLGFGQSRLHFAAPVGADMSVDALDGLRIATSYAGVLEEYLKERALSAHVIRLDGAVETAVRLGVADVIADVVSTGLTLRQAGLEVVGDVVVRSEAVLIGRAGGPADPAIDQLVRRLQGVLVARRYVMMAYDVPVALLEQACVLTPGIESPTISPLQNRNWMAVNALVLRRETNRVMDALWELGARGILVTDISACRF